MCWWYRKVLGNAESYSFGTGERVQGLYQVKGTTQFQEQPFSASAKGDVQVAG
jgi:hypothetical protein